MTDIERLEAMFAEPEVGSSDPRSVLGRALLLAQRAADATIADARAEADRIRREAHAEARQVDSLLDALRDQVASLSDELASVEAAAAAARLEVTSPRGDLHLAANAPVEPPAAPAIAPPRPVPSTPTYSGELHLTAVDQPAAPVASQVTAAPTTPSPAPVAAAPEPAPAPAPRPAPAPGRSIGPIPVEAILPMVAIVIVLIVVLAWLG